MRQVHALTRPCTPLTDVPAELVALRSRHDRNANKWPVHVSLIYPFFRTALFPTAAEKLRLVLANDQRLRVPKLTRGRSGLKAKPLTITMSPLGHFSTAKEHVLFTEPVQGGKEQLVSVYQEACRALQLDPATVKPYSPKLIVGRFENEDQLQECLSENGDKFK